MCEANAYILDDDGNEILLLDSVDKLIPIEDELQLENIYGQRKIIRAKIKELALVEHKIILERLKI